QKPNDWLLYARRARTYTEERKWELADALGTLRDLAHAYRGVGRHADVLRALEEEFALAKGKFGPDHPELLPLQDEMATVYLSLGRSDEALKLREETLLRMRKHFGTRNIHTVTSMHNLAQNYYMRDRYDEALKLWEEAVPLLKAEFGPDHPKTLHS